MQFDAYHCLLPLRLHNFIRASPTLHSLILPALHYNDSVPAVGSFLMRSGYQFITCGMCLCSFSMMRGRLM
jgi:hypothetical protein